MFSPLSLCLFIIRITQNLLNSFVLDRFISRTWTKSCFLHVASDQHNIIFNWCVVSYSTANRSQHTPLCTNTTLHKLKLHQWHFWMGHKYLFMFGQIHWIKSSYFSPDCFTFCVLAPLELIFNSTQTPHTFISPWIFFFPMFSFFFLFYIFTTRFGPLLFFLAGRLFRVEDTYGEVPALRAVLVLHQDAVPAGVRRVHGRWWWSWRTCLTQTWGCSGRRTWSPCRSSARWPLARGRPRCCRWDWEPECRG